MSNSITITLSKPIVHEGQSISTLTFREANVGDLCAADAVHGDTMKLLAVLAGMAGTIIPVLQKIPAREFAQIMKQVGPLMGEAEAATGQA